MRKLTPLELPGWALVPIVLALTVPIVAGFLVAGPALGLAVGALAATALVIVAARIRYDEPIEVARRSDDRFHLLIVASAAVDERAASAVAELVALASRRDGAEGADPDVLVLAPALNRGLSHWASDLGGALVRAQERLVVSVASLAVASVDGRGEVGDSDPIQAAEDTLRSFPAQEVFLVEDPGASRSVVEELRRRLDRPLHHFEVGGAEPASRERARESGSS